MLSLLLIAGWFSIVVAVAAAWFQIGRKYERALSSRPSPLGQSHETQPPSLPDTAWLEIPTAATRKLGAIYYALAGPYWTIAAETDEEAIALLCARLGTDEEQP